jgi:cyclopropane fatty-acyl-phospholipid synthase-like methyltransferase
MIKYLMTAAALKSFSISPQTKRVYRLLGNILDQRRRMREGLNTYYVDRTKKILELCEKHHAIQKGEGLLEVGTGWLHWESMIIRLFYDVEITMFDVWDNRYFGAYKQYFRQLEEIIDRELDMDSMQRERVHNLLHTILRARSFDEIYDLLGLRYVINPSGTLKQFQDESFAVIFSCDVLEHIDKSILPEFIQDFHRLLKPGGYSIHKIDIIDHLYYYDTSVPIKNYLRYSDKVWRRYFENDVQYINKVQRPDWLDLFHKAGFELVEEESISADIGTIEVDRVYKNLSRQDMQCVTLTIVHRKPD